MKCLLATVLFATLLISCNPQPDDPLIGAAGILPGKLHSPTMQPLVALNEEILMTGAGGRGRPAS